MGTVISNPALAESSLLVGDWDMALSGASFLPDKDQVVQGKVEVRPVEAGSLLAMRQGIQPPNPPAATWVIGRDESQGDYTVLYADSRGVSRVYRMTLSNEQWRLWRENAEFSQRFEATISADHNQIAGRWEKRTMNGEWEHDFNVTYTRNSSGWNAP